MANRAYVRVWSKDFSEATMLEHLEQLLKTVPYSAERPGLIGLVIHAVDPSETSLIDMIWASSRSALPSWSNWRANTCMPIQPMKSKHVGTCGCTTPA